MYKLVGDKNMTLKRNTTLVMLIWLYSLQLISGLMKHCIIWTLQKQEIDAAGAGVLCMYLGCLQVWSERVRCKYLGSLQVCSERARCVLMCVHVRECWCVLGTTLDIWQSSFAYPDLVASACRRYIIDLQLVNACLATSSAWTVLIVTALVLFTNQTPVMYHLGSTVCQVG